MRPEPLTSEQARDPHEAWSNGWSNGFASAREVTDEMVRRALLVYLSADAKGLMPARAMRRALAAAFQDNDGRQEAER